MTAFAGRLFKLKIEYPVGSGTYIDFGGLTNCTVTITNEEVDITDKFSNGVKELLENAGVQSISVSGELYTKDVIPDALVNEYAVNGTVCLLKVVSDQGDFFNFSAQISSLERSGSFNDMEKYSLSFASSDGLIFYPDYWYAQFDTSAAAFIGMASRTATIASADDIIYKVKKDIGSSTVTTSSEPLITYTTGIYSRAAQSPNGNILVGTKYLLITSLFRYRKDIDSWDSYAIPSFGVSVSFDYCNGYFYLFYNSTTGGVRRIKDDFSDSWTKVSDFACVGRQIAYCSALNLYVLPTGVGNIVLYSNDGITWTQGSSSISALYAVASEDKILISGIAQNTYYYTVDGTNYTAQTLPAGVLNYGEMAYGDGKFVFSVNASAGFARISHSANGLTGSWSTAQTGAITTGNYTAVTYYFSQNKSFVSFAEGSNVFYNTSEDLSSWAEVFAWNSVIDYNSVACNIGGNLVIIKSGGELKTIGLSFPSSTNIKVWHDTVSGKIYSSVNDSTIILEYTGVIDDLKPVAYDPINVTLDTVSTIVTHPDANDWQPYGA